MVLKFCANLSMMFVDQSPELLGRYALAKQAGFSAVETSFPYQADATLLKDELTKHGLKQILINTSPGDCYGFAALEGREDDFMESLQKSVSYCKALNCKL